MVWAGFGEGQELRLVACGEVEEHRDDDERDDGVQRLDGHVVPGLRGYLDLGAAAPVEDDAPQDQAPDQHARGERSRPRALPEGQDPGSLFRHRSGHTKSREVFPLYEQPVLSPGPGPQSAPAAASAASGAATSGRSRWDSRSAFPRVSPALVGYGRLAGRSPPWHTGRGLDVYADQTLLDAIWGRAGRVPNAPSESPKGWSPGGIPASGRHLTAPRPGPSGRARPAGVSVAPVPYFDAASSAPLHPVARQALQASLDEGWADPARLYREGRRARLLLDAAREAAAEAVGCRPDELSFTRSGTQCGARGNFRILVRASACRAAPGGVGGRALLGAACGGRPRGGRRLGHRGRRWTVRAGSPPTRTPRPCAPTPRSPASSPPTTRWARSSRWPRWPRRAGRRGCRCWWTRRSRWAGGRSRAPGRCWRRARTNGAVRPESGCSRCARASGSRLKGPADERESGRAPGFENIPAIVAAAASLRAVRAERGGRGGAAAGAGGPDPGPGRGAGAGRGGGRRSGAAAAAPGHLLLSLCRRRDAAARARPGGFLRFLRFVLHEQHPDAQPCAARDGGAERGQCPGVAAAGHAGGRRSTGSWRCCRGGGRRRVRTQARGAPVRGRRRPGGRRSAAGRSSWWTRSAGSARSR